MSSLCGEITETRVALDEVAAPLVALLFSPEPLFEQPATSESAAAAQSTLSGRDARVEVEL